MCLDVGALAQWDQNTSRLAGLKLEQTPAQRVALKFLTQSAERVSPALLDSLERVAVA